MCIWGRWVGWADLSATLAHQQVIIGLAARALGVEVGCPATGAAPGAGLSVQAAAAPGRAGCEPGLAGAHAPAADLHSRRHSLEPLAMTSADSGGPHCELD